MHSISEMHTMLRNHILSVVRSPSSARVEALTFAGLEHNPRTNTLQNPKSKIQNFLRVFPFHELEFAVNVGKYTLWNHPYRVAAVSRHLRDKAPLVRVIAARR